MGMDPRSLQKTLNTGIPENKYELIRSTVISANGAGATSYIRLGIIPYKQWRVISCGFVCDVVGASTILEDIQIGLQLSDAGATDTDAFARWVQDATAGKNFAAGDMLMSKPNDILTPVTTLENAGAPTFTLGILHDVWQYKQGAILLLKNNVASSTATVLGWCLIEIGQL